MQREDPYRDTEQVGQLIGVSSATVRLYLKRTRRRITDGKPVRKQDFPLPDDMFGRSPVWRESTILTWVGNRPGRGRRGPE
jgi:predicted DNA-binding transcriptional regulator AlpA